MATENRRLNNYGRAGNDAGGNITVGQQRIDQRKETNIDTGPTNIAINIKTVLKGPSLVPTTPAAAFLGRKSEFTSDRDIIYDDRLGKHILTQDSLHLTSYLCQLWSEAQPVFNQLNSTLSNLHDTSRHSIPIDHLASNDSLEGQKRSIQAKLVEAIRGSKNVYTTRSSTSSYLIGIKENLECYISWIGLLPYKTENLCFCNVFDHVLSELLDSKRMNIAILQILADITNAFAIAKDYMELYMSRRLTISLHQHTVSILRALASLLQELAIYTWSRTKPKEEHNKKLDALIESLRTYLEKSNSEAKSVKKLPSAEECSPSGGNYNLDIIRSFSNFLTTPVARGLGMLAGEGIGIQEYDLKLDKLIRYLAYDKAQSTKDVERLALPKEMDSSSLNKLAGLTKHDKFQDWLREDKKTTSLLIQGRFENASGNSPLSHLCARFPNEYLRRGQKGIVFLHYFCSVQSRHRGRLANACDLVGNLTAQLIANPQLAPSIDITSLSQTDMKRIREGDLGQTILLFRQVLDQVSNESVVIFCFIDSISVYETGGRREDTLQFFGSLCDFLKRRRRRSERSKRMVFKLLVTEAGRTNHVYKYFRPPGQILNMY